jgi:L-gulono-1,4-lactone dehydrogenase
MSSGRTWTSWSGLSTSQPTQVMSPTDTDDVVDAVLAARANGLRVKMVGSGHSFTDVAVCDGLLLRPERLTGITAVDRDAMTVTVRAGTTIRELNARLAGLGLGLHNMGDIDRQTVAGAISTGTHGAGGRWASLSSQVQRLVLVAGDGSVLDVSATSDPDLLAAARVGLGAVGIITEVTFRVEPEFLLTAVEEPLSWGRLVDDFDDVVDGHEHVDILWFPHTETALCKEYDRGDGDRRPLSRLRKLVGDDVLANGVFGATNRLGNAAPRAIPTLNRVVARALSTRRYRDTAPSVFVAERKVRFREMEYAVPRAAGRSALVEARRVLERSGHAVSFPVEVRAAPADDAWLSMAHDRPTVYLAFHVNAQTDHRAYFAEMERVMRAHDGRPHWGKLHTRTAADLAPAYPRWSDFAAVRDRTDPDRLFTNKHLDRVLGP